MGCTARLVKGRRYGHGTKLRPLWHALWMLGSNTRNWLGAFPKDDDDDVYTAAIYIIITAKGQFPSWRPPHSITSETSSSLSDSWTRGGGGAAAAAAAEGSEMDRKMVSLWSGHTNTRVGAHWAARLMALHCCHYCHWQRRRRHSSYFLCFYNSDVPHSLAFFQSPGPHFAFCGRYRDARASTTALCPLFPMINSTINA